MSFHVQVACPAGTFCVVNAVNPAPCRVGSYNPASVVSVCQPCPSGAFCPLGSLVASSCPVGTFNSVLGKSDLSDCVSCPSSNVTGSATYCSVGSVVSTTPCPAGSYCPTPASLVQCESNFYCPQGSKAPVKCQQGLFSVAGQAACTSTCIGGQYPDTSKTTESCLSCPAGFSCQGGGALKVQKFACQVSPV